MGRTSRLLTVMGLVLPVFYFGAAGEAAAFCIENAGDVAFQVKQTHGGTHVPFKKFDKNIEPGGKACCNWQTHDCNTEGKKSAPVKFDVIYYPPVPSANEPNMYYYCRGFEIQADGKMVIHGAQGEYACKHE